MDEAKRPCPKLALHPPDDGSGKGVQYRGRLSVHWAPVKVYRMPEPLSSQVDLATICPLPSVGSAWPWGLQKHCRRTVLRLSAPSLFKPRTGVRQAAQQKHRNKSLAQPVTGQRSLGSSWLTCSSVPWPTFSPPDACPFHLLRSSKGWKDLPPAAQPSQPPHLSLAPRSP